MSDDLTGIFDHLTPNDFARPSSAFLERHPAAHLPPFEQFLDTQLAAVRFGYTAASGQFNPMCMLASATIERAYAPEPDETMGQYVARLADEARRMAAQWVFFAIKTQVASVLVDPEGPLPDVADLEAIAAAAARGEHFTPAVYFYAECRHGTRRQGYMAVQGRHLAEPTLAELDQSLQLLGRIFGSSQ